MDEILQNSTRNWIPKREWSRTTGKDEILPNISDKKDSHDQHGKTDEIPPEKPENRKATATKDTDEIPPEYIEQNLRCIGKLYY